MQTEATKKKGKGGSVQHRYCADIWTHLGCHWIGAKLGMPPFVHPHHNITANNATPQHAEVQCPLVCNRRPVSHAGNTSTKESPGSANRNIVIVLMHLKVHLSKNFTLALGSQGLPNNDDSAGRDVRASHRLENPVTKQHRSHKLSKENNILGTAKLSFPMPATQAQTNLRDLLAVNIANPPLPCRPLDRCVGIWAERVLLMETVSPARHALTRHLGPLHTYTVRPYPQLGQDSRSVKSSTPLPLGASRDWIKQ